VETSRHCDGQERALNDTTGAENEAGHDATASQTAIDPASVNTFLSIFSPVRRQWSRVSQPADEESGKAVGQIKQVTLSTEFNSMNPRAKPKEAQTHSKAVALDPSVTPCLINAARIGDDDEMCFGAVGALAFVLVRKLQSQ
jgi:hypothetical protein